MTLRNSCQLWSSNPVCGLSLILILYQNSEASWHTTKQRKGHDRYRLSGRQLDCLFFCDLAVEKEDLLETCHIEKLRVWVSRECGRTCRARPVRAPDTDSSSPSVGKRTLVSSVDGASPFAARRVSRWGFSTCEGQGFGAVSQRCVGSLSIVLEARAIIMLGAEGA